MGQNIFHQKRCYLSWILKNEEAIFRRGTGEKEPAGEDSKLKGRELHGCAD